MHSDKFEGALDAFLESPEYDRVEEAIYQLARAAFEAGWNAAGGEKANDGGKIVDILRNPEK